MSSPRQNNEENDASTRRLSSPSLFQRLVSFIDSPCSGLGISTSADESPRPTRTSVGSRESEPTKSPAVVTPIKSPSSTATSRRKIRNRSYASRKVRQEKLDALLNQMQLTSLERDRIYFNPPIRSSPLRRVKSLQANPSPTSVAAADSIFWTDSTDQVETVYCRPIGDCCVDTAPSEKSSSVQDKWGLFCCNDTTSASAFEQNVNATLTSQECDGYVDYQGNHHPHVSTKCQGCIFRQSHVDKSGACNEDELFYDSDYELYFRSCQEKKQSHLETPKRRSLTSSSIIGTIVDDQQSCFTEGSSPDRQSYMYDYFTSNQQRQPMQNPLRTGLNATPESDVGVYVQEALNSTWKLLWHTTKSANSLSAFLPQPKPCTVWIERGFRRNLNQAVEPRLMWREVKAHTTYTELMERPNSLSMLAIRRIIPGEQVAESFIFTKSSCMIVVKSSLGKDYWFEAASASERDHISHLWKMVTARLVAYAATQSTEQMVNEFFNEYSVF